MNRADDVEVIESKLNSSLKRPLVQTKLSPLHFKRTCPAFENAPITRPKVETHELLSDDEDEQEDSDEIEVLFDSKPDTGSSSYGADRHKNSISFNTSSSSFNTSMSHQPNDDDLMEDDSLDECDLSELNEICEKIQTNCSTTRPVANKFGSTACKSTFLNKVANVSTRTTVAAQHQSLLTDDDEEEEKEEQTRRKSAKTNVKPLNKLSDNLFDGQLVFKRDKVSVNKNEKSDKKNSNMATIKVKQEPVAPATRTRTELDVGLGHSLLSSDSDTSESRFMIRPLSIVMPHVSGKLIRNEHLSTNDRTSKATTLPPSKDNTTAQQRQTFNSRAKSLLADRTSKTVAPVSVDTAVKNAPSPTNQPVAAYSSGVEHEKSILGYKRRRNCTAKPISDDSPPPPPSSSSSTSVAQNKEKKPTAQKRVEPKSTAPKLTASKTLGNRVVEPGVVAIVAPVVAPVVIPPVDAKSSKNSVENDKKGGRSLESYAQKSNVCRYSQTEFDIFDLLRNKREKHEQAESKPNQVPIGSTSPQFSSESSCASSGDDSNEGHRKSSRHTAAHRPTDRTMPIDRERPLTLNQNLKNHRLQLKHKKTEMSVSAQIKETFETILLDILTWKTSWLKEELADLLPPQLCQEPLRRPELIYQNFNDYMAVFKPLILLEIWANVLERFGTLKSMPTKYVSLFPVAYSEDNHFVIFTCKLALSNREFGRSSHPVEGDLLLLELHLLSTSNESANSDSNQSDNQMALANASLFPTGRPKSHVIVVFGYVHDLTVQEINKDTSNNTAYQYERHCDKMLRYSIKTRCLNLRLDTSKMVRARSLGYVRPQLRQCEAICSLQFSPLKNAILKPNFQYSQVLLPSNHSPTCNDSTWNDYNASQMKTIVSSLELIKQPQNTNKILLIQGPPGTGKTHTIIGMVKKIYMDWESEKYPKILICAPSNGAIDEIAMRLYQVRHFFAKSRAKRALRLVRIGQEDQIHPTTRRIYIDSLVESNLDQIRQERHENNSTRQDELDQQLTKLVAESVELKRRQVDAEDEEVRRVEREIQRVTLKIADLRRNPYTAEKGNPQLDLDKVRKNLRRDILIKADIILSTLNSCRNQQLSQIYKESKTFNCCIVDEASQCCEPEILMPLNYLSITKFILIGDPMQLPATVISTKALEYGYGRSLFERHFNYFNSQKKQNNPILMLDTQYRMHREICQFPSTYFYQNRLKS